MSQLSDRLRLGSHEFTLRQCPLCGSPARRSLCEPEAASFCASNPTYSLAFRRILGLPPVARFPIDACGACGMAYARWLPPRAFLDAVYEEVIQGDACARVSASAPDRARRVRDLAPLIALAPGQPRVLDYGSGLGITASILAAIGAETLAFDPSPSRRARASCTNVRWLRDEEQVGSAAPFDALVLDNVIEHLPHPKDVLRHLGSACASGAVALVSVPDYGRRRLRVACRVARLGGPLDPTLNPWEHLNYFDLRHLDVVLAEGGFTRLNASRLPGSVDVGLRPEAQVLWRLANAGKSALRVLRYAFSGRGVETPERAYYVRG